jgi:Peptidase family S41
MSEKIYALLLRLYPASFRNRYSDESMQLLRDLLRDERGFLARLRLWFDLLGDLAFSLPREHQARRPSAALAASPQPISGMPSFRLIDRPPLRPAFVLFAVTLSAAGTAAFVLLLNYAGTQPASRLSLLAKHAHQQAATPQNSTPPPPVSSNTAGAVSSTGNASALASGAPPAIAQSKDHSDSAILEVAPVAIDPAERHRVIVAAAENLRTHYYDSTLAQSAANVLVSQENSSADAHAADGASLAALLTSQMRGVTHDMHLEVVYSQTNLPPAPVAPSAAALAAYRQTLLQQNCALEKASILPPNIGYLKINAFPDPSICGSQFRSAMASLDHSRALIVDLRDNRGGDPAMVALVSGYLFNRPQPWYNPREATPSLLAAPVPGSHLGDKPVYILTSKLTFSAAEHFTYNLKMLHRATVVGEITGGAAHAGTFHRLDDHFGMGIPEFRIINPYSDRDWEGVGIAPDVQVKAATALTTAVTLARQAQIESHR